MVELLPVIITFAELPRNTGGFPTVSYIPVNNPEQTQAQSQDPVPASFPVSLCGHILVTFWLLTAET